MKRPGIFKKGHSKHHNKDQGETVSAEDVESLREALEALREDCDDATENLELARVASRTLQLQLRQQEDRNEELSKELAESSKTSETVQASPEALDKLRGELVEERKRNLRSVAEAAAAEEDRNDLEEQVQQQKAKFDKLEANCQILSSELAAEEKATQGHFEELAELAALRSRLEKQTGLLQTQTQQAEQLRSELKEEQKTAADFSAKASSAAAFKETSFAELSEDVERLRGEAAASAARARSLELERESLELRNSEVSREQKEEGEALAEQRRRHELRQEELTQQLKEELQEQQQQQRQQQTEEQSQLDSKDEGRASPEQELQLAELESKLKQQEALTESLQAKLSEAADEAERGSLTGGDEDPASYRSVMEELEKLRLKGQEAESTSSTLVAALRSELEEHEKHSKNQQIELDEHEKRSKNQQNELEEHEKRSKKQEEELQEERSQLAVLQARLSEQQALWEKEKEKEKREAKEREAEKEDEHKDKEKDKDDEQEREEAALPDFGLAGEEDGKVADSEDKEVLTKDAAKLAKEEQQLQSQEALRAAELERSELTEKVSQLESEVAANAAKLRDFSDSEALCRRLEEQVASESELQESQRQGEKANFQEQQEAQQLLQVQQLEQKQKERDEELEAGAAEREAVWKTRLEESEQEFEIHSKTILELRKECSEVSVELAAEEGASKHLQNELEELRLAEQRAEQFEDESTALRAELTALSAKSSTNDLSAKFSEFENRSEALENQLAGRLKETEQQCEALKREREELASRLDDTEYALQVTSEAAGEGISVEAAHYQEVASWRRRCEALSSELEEQRSARIEDHPRGRPTSQFGSTARTTDATAAPQVWSAVQALRNEFKSTEEEDSPKFMSPTSHQDSPHQDSPACPRSATPSFAADPGESIETLQLPPLTTSPLVAAAAPMGKADSEGRAAADPPSIPSFSPLPRDGIAPTMFTPPTAAPAGVEKASAESIELEKELAALRESLTRAESVSSDSERHAKSEAMLVSQMREELLQFSKELEVSQSDQATDMALSHELKEEREKNQRLGELALRSEQSRRKLLLELAQDEEVDTDLIVLAKVLGRAVKAIDTITQEAPLRAVEARGDEDSTTDRQQLPQHHHHHHHHQRQLPAATDLTRQQQQQQQHQQPQQQQQHHQQQQQQHQQEQERLQPHYAAQPKQQYSPFGSTRNRLPPVPAASSSKKEVDATDLL